MVRIFSRVVISACVSILATESLSAAEVAEAYDAPIVTDTLTVVGRRRELATVQSITGAELRGLASTSIADALKYMAGVQIKDYGGLGGLKTVNVRSLGAQHVGVYVDGVRVTNAQNGTVDLGKFALSTMESVSLYNANKLEDSQSPSEYASGATVYLRTRRPTGDSLSVGARLASFHTYTLRATAQLKRRKWSGWIDGEWLSTRGDYPFRYHSEYEDTIGRRANSDITYGRAEAALFSGGLSAHAYCYISERGCPGGIVRRLSDKYNNVGREWDRDFFAQASYDVFPIGVHKLKFIVKYSHEYLRYCTDYPENQNTARANNRYLLNDVYASVAYAWRVRGWLSVNTGYDCRMSWLAADLKRFEPVRRMDQKAVLAAQASRGDWRGAASLLWQHYKDYTNLSVGAAKPLCRVTPSVSVSWGHNGLTVRAWWKRIFRAPTLNDLYYTQVGNRNLKPEYTRQLDIGAEYAIGGSLWGVSAQIDLYRNSVENRIVCLPLKGTYTWSMMNYGRTLCHGLNATISGRRRVGDVQLSLVCSLTWQRDVNRTDATDEEVYNKPICYSPTLSSGVTAMAQWRQWSLSVSELHVGKRMWSYADAEDMLAAYNNIDARLCYDRRRWSAALEVFDVLDVQYEHIPRYPMPGRQARLSVTVMF